LSSRVITLRTLPLELRDLHHPEAVSIVLLAFDPQRPFERSTAPLLVEIGPLPEHLLLEVVGELGLRHSIRIAQLRHEDLR